MQLRLPLLGLIGLVAAGACAGEPAGTPLEGTKQELKKLQTDQTTQNSTAATGRLTDGVPQIQTPVPGAAQLEMPGADKAEKDRKKKAEARKHWLLEGVDKLGRSDGGKNRGRAARENEDTLPDDEKDRLESTDPDYILKLYTQQKQADEAKSGQQKATATRVDPFAPFLQGWLDKSPVRGKFFDEFVRRTDGADGAPMTAPAVSQHGFSQRSDGVERADAVRSVPAAAQPNPYLQELDTPALRELEVSSGQPAALANVPASPAPKQSAGSMLDPVPASRPAEKKPLLLAPSDDKKYFPQLKKF